MSHLSCPVCSLGIYSSPLTIRLQRCPRCYARSREIVLLVDDTREVARKRRARADERPSVPASNRSTESEYSVN